MTTTGMGPPPPRDPTTTTTAAAAAANSPSSSADPQTKGLDSPSPSSSAPRKTTPMGPPPPIDPNIETNSPSPPSDPQTKSVVDSPSPSTSSPPMKINPMAPPPPIINPNPPNPDSSGTLTNASQESQPHTVYDDNSTTEEEHINNVDISNGKHEQQQHHPIPSVPYTIPSWTSPPCHHYFLEVLKDGFIIDQFDVYEKGAYMFGRVDLCDFVLEHPTISRFHAVLQFKSNGDAYLYDLSSTHGTCINKNQVKKNAYVELHVGDVIRFGHSSRLYIFQGPAELMLPEKDLKTIKNAKIREEMKDMEASLRRAKLEASLADGITWGMDEDAIEENEDDLDEITWQTYKGQLTEKQEKTHDKIANMKKEIDAIRAKDIAQGGLTQGQQTQIARNEQRMSQIVEELENLEETLNESIRESLGARTGRFSRGKKKGATEDDDEEYLSDDDEFYDRAKAKTSKPKGAETQSIETADSLLDKKDVIIKEMEDKRKLLLEEKDRLASKNEVEEAEAGDALDAYMSGLSSQLVLDKTEQLEKELQTLQSDLHRVLYLLKIADPTEEFARKRESKSQELKPSMSKLSAPAVVKQPPKERSKKQGSKDKASSSIQEQGRADDASTNSTSRPEELELVHDATAGKTTTYTVVKPQWLGAVKNKEAKQTHQEAPIDTEESAQFIDYKDRKKVLGNEETAQVNVDLGIENAAPGLIIRKRKQVEKSDVSEVKGSEESTSVSPVGPEIRAEDAVALLLKHARGYHASADDESDDMVRGNQTGKGKKKPKKVLGPEKPSFLGSKSTDFEAWVPPQDSEGKTIRVMCLVRKLADNRILWGIINTIIADME
ncbi:hypothetical protein LguiB_019569 [Lonicera macranthoides]